MTQRAGTAKRPQRNTHQRALVLSAVEAHGNHPTAEDIYQYVRQEDDHISRSTVYRNLHLLVDNGSIISLKTDSGERFDRRTDAHAHLICEVCGRIVDVPQPTLPGVDKLVAEETGFEIHAHQIEFSGICPECMAALRKRQAQKAGSAELSPNLDK